MLIQIQFILLKRKSIIFVKINRIKINYILACYFRSKVIHLDLFALPEHFQNWGLTVPILLVIKM